jgi:hypothetical protein
MNYEQQSKADIINKQLIKFGINMIGLPNYKVVWSENVQEKRYGVFRDYVGSLFIREFKGVPRSPKI